MDGRVFDPFTLKMTESFLKVKLFSSKTRQERMNAKIAIDKVRFLRVAYKLLSTEGLEPIFTEEYRDTLKSSRTKKLFRELGLGQAPDVRLHKPASASAHVIRAKDANIRNVIDNRDYEILGEAWQKDFGS